MSRTGETKKAKSAGVKTAPSAASHAVAGGVASAGEEVVGLKGIELRREERLVLKDVDLSIRRGQHWVLLGPNGSGKSSLLGVLQGLLWPIEGEIRVLGNRFGESDLSELRRLIGWVETKSSRSSRPGRPWSRSRGPVAWAP